MMTGFAFFNFSFPLEILLHYPRWYSNDLNAVRDVFRHHRSGTNHRACANREMVDHHRPHPNVAASADRARTSDVGAGHDTAEIADRRMVSYQSTAVYQHVRANL